MIKVFSLFIFYHFFPNLKLKVKLKVLYKKKKWFLFFMISSLFIILFHDNLWPHVIRRTWQKPTDREYETLPHLPYSPELLSANYFFFFFFFFFSSIWTLFFIYQNALCSKGEVETASNHFLVSKPLDFFIQA